MAILQNETGTTTQAIKQDAWGVQTQNTYITDAVLPTEFGFTGHKFDSDSNLTYAHARYYDGAQRIWKSQDQMSIYGFITDAFLVDPQNQNSYSYVGNNPVNMIDPDGNSRADYTLDLTKVVDASGRYNENVYMGTYKGVPLYSRWNNYMPHDNDGLRNQCAQGVKTIYSKAFGINIGQVGTAANMFNVLQSGDYKNQFSANVQGSNVMPKENDILIWEGGLSGSGHTGIISQIDWNSKTNTGIIWLVEQNYVDKLTNERSLKFSKNSNGGYVVENGSKDLTVKGWVHPTRSDLQVPVKGLQTTSPVPQSAPSANSSANKQSLYSTIKNVINYFMGAVKLGK